jgi:hypothetical protein
MTKRPAISSTKAKKTADTAPGSALRRSHAPSVGITQRTADRALSLEDAEERYVAARDAWASAMRGAASGRPADLATLAVVQEAYEAALAERDRWASGARIPIAVEPDRPKSIEAAVRQEVTWRLAHQGEQDGKPTRGLRSLLRRMRGR